MSSRRCNHCRKRWPTNWRACPGCGRGTQPMTLAPTHTHEQAMRHVEDRFERFIADREQRRIAEGHIAPEALGKREARQIIELERQVNPNEGVA